MAVVQCPKCEGSATVTLIGKNRRNQSYPDVTLAHCLHFRAGGDGDDCPYLENAIRLAIAAGKA